MRQNPPTTDFRHVESALPEANDDDALAIEAREVADFSFCNDRTGVVGLAIESRPHFSLGVLTDRDQEVIELLSRLT